MKVRIHPQGRAIVLAAGALFVVSQFPTGCGGGSASALNGGGSGGSGNVPIAQATNTATFQVDLASGHVAVVSGAGQGKSIVQNRAVFLGNTIGFGASDLLNDSGVTTGIRTTNVTLTNNFGLAIGSDPSGVFQGVKVVLGPITNLSAALDLRPLINVGSFAGTGVNGYANGPLATATFGNVHGLAVDNQGSVYVTDSYVPRVRKIANGLVSAVAGGGTAGTLGVGPLAGFGNPRGIAINPVDGALIMADAGTQQIYRITPSGSVTLVAGSLNTPGATNGPGNSASFNSPQGIVIDPSGNIYVSDGTGDLIRKITLVGNPTVAANYTVSTVAGTGTAGAANGPLGVGSFNGPSGLALDNAGDLFVADTTNNKIRMVDLASGNTITLAGNGAGTSTDGLGSTATLNNPRGLCYVNGSLIVSEQGSNRMRQMNLLPGSALGSSASWQVSTLTSGGTGAVDGDGTVASFNTLDQIANSPSGAIYISDVNGHKVRRLIPSTGTFPVGIVSGSTSTNPVVLANPDGFEAGTAAGASLPYMLYPSVLQPGQSSQPKSWSFNVPAGVTAFTFTVTVIADTPVPATVDSDTKSGSNQSYVRTIAGSAISGMRNGPEVSALFHGWLYSARDANGNLYLGDTYNNAIRRIDVNGTVSTLAGDTGVPGALNGTGDVAQFQEPAGIAVSADGRTIYVADNQNNLVRRIVQTGPDVTQPSSWTVSTLAGTGTAGTVVSAADTPGDVVNLNAPMGIVLDPTSSTLYITEQAGNRIRSIHLRGSDASNPHNWIVGFVAGDPNGTTGLVNGVMASARFHGPFGIALDPQGNLYVADEINNSIRKIVPGNVVSTLAGSIGSGYLDGVGTSALFYNPVGVAVDKGGTVYVADYSNNRIRAVAPNGYVTTVAGNGVAAHVDGPASSVARISFPVGIAVEPSGTLLIGSQNDPTLRAIDRSFSTAN